MDKLIKKIKVASVSGIVTILICITQSVSSYASDTELYRPPQNKEMTLMFMLDVSASMNPNRNNYGENRLQSLKNGMLTLMQGDSSKGISPLPDQLIAGLSTFNGTTGRIKLEAMSLGSAIPLDGVRELYKTIQVNNQLATRTQTREKIDEDWKEITQTQTRSCFIGCGSWSTWSPAVTTTSWAPKSTRGSYGSTIVSTPTLSAVTPSGSVIAQECTEWNADNTCKTWVSTTKQPSDFASATPSVSSVGPSYGSWSNSGAPTPILTSVEGPRGLEDGSETLSDCFFGINCEKNSRTVKKERTTKTITETQVQTTTASSTTTTVYKGTAYQTHRQRMINEVNKLQATDGTPTAFAYAEVAAYMLGQTTSGTGSGFTESTMGSTTTVNGVVKKTGIRDANNYFNPPAVDGTKTCNSQGIYFLTDGVPEYSNRISAQAIMQASLNNTNFTCSDTSLNQSGDFYDDYICDRYGRNCVRDSISKTNWQCIASLSKKLVEGKIENNPAGASILTAVVGFGSDMGSNTPSDAYKNDIAAAKKWGEIGKGGFYKGNSEQSIVESVTDFLGKLDKYIPSVTVGSATVPIDALDTQNVQPWVYFPQFDPRPNNINTGAATWIGNVKKYKTINNNLLDRGNEIITDNKGLIKDDLNDYWANTSITKNITKEINGNNVSFTVKVGGALSQLPLGYNVNNTPIERRIFTDRTIQVSSTDSTTNQIGSISSGNLKKIGRNDFISSSVNQFKEDPKRGYILSLFGYNVNKTLADNINISPKDINNQNQLEQLLTNNATLRQMGAVMHSRPILLTQQGTTKYENEVLSYDDRDDLILFGTTQGLLHIVKAGKTATDTDAGKELFTFVPNEMIENQAEAFLNQESQSGTLQYGIDGQWTAYTEYVTQKGSNSTDEPVVTVKGGKQWVYGGLRMGGKSYYALDLTDISSTDNNTVPKLKFRINPSATSSGPLSYMGQSWSKPNITWVNWKGKRKLVMFVGGGYDMGYEADVYNQVNGVGAGVYMFDADNGDLLWWASSNLAADVNSENSPNALKVDDMKYSVVSQIKTVDRNNDGLVDHLYFGDLGGQVWRVDLNNTKTLTDAFAKRAVKILNLNKTNGSSPRFYTTPSFTIHNGGASGLFATISLGSGDLSSPMSAESSSGKDNIYVIFDKDVTKANLYQLTDNQLITRNIVIGSSGNTLAVNTDGNTKTTLARAGWYYPLANKLRVLNDTVAIAGDLYVSVFDSSKDLDALSCSGGVRGESNVEQFCLPYGQCSEIKNGSEVIGTRLKDVPLGKGNIGIAFGGSTGTPSPDRTLILNVSKPVGKVLPNYPGKLKLVSQRWYEKYAKAS